MIWHDVTLVFFKVKKACIFFWVAATSKTWSCVVHGRSPGSNIDTLTGINSIDDCKAQCESLSTCQAIIYYEYSGQCIRLARFYNEYYEETTDEVWLANLDYGFNCSNIPSEQHTSIFFLKHGLKCFASLKKLKNIWI